MTIYSSIVQNIRTTASDTVRIVDTADSDLSNYLDIETDDSNSYVTLLPKINELRIQDPDDSDDSDYAQFHVGDGEGGLLINSTRITDGDIIKVDHNGTIDGSSGTVDLTILNLDLSGITINDGAANAVTLSGLYADWSGITNTAVGLSNLYGIDITMPDISGYNDGAAIKLTMNAASDVAISTNGKVKCADLVASGTLDWSANPCKPKIESAGSEPDISNNTMELWWDSTNSKLYLLVDYGGTQYKVELT